MDDIEIYSLFWDRNEEAIVQTHQKYGPWCRGIAMRILDVREDAEECIFDTYLRAWNHIPPERPQIFRSWLGRITRNIALSRYRQTHAQKRGGGETALALDELRECVSGDDFVQEERQAIVTAISHFLEELSQEQRGIFLRRYWHLSSIQEIAKGYNISESKVTSMLSRLRKRLREELEKEGITI